MEPRRGETYEGKPCETCGGALRYVLSRKCAPCKKARSRKWQENKTKDEVWVAKENERKKIWRENNWAKARAATDRWEKQNRDRVNKNARRRRMENPDKYRDKANRWRQKSPEKVKKYTLMASYGMTAEEYYQLFDKQEGLCLICLAPEKENRLLSVDHCHYTGKIRGLLCKKCNTGIGMLQDDPELLKRALAYLDENK